MKQQYRQLIRALLVLPTVGTESAFVLGAESIVALVPQSEADAHPYEIPRERLVRYVDASGVESLGWIATNALLRISTEGTKLVYVRGDLRLSPLDQLRNQVNLLQMRDTETRWSLEYWCSIFGAAQLPLLYDVARELGGRLPPGADADLVISRVLRLTILKEIAVSDVETTRESAPSTTKTKKVAAKKSGAKSAAKKSTKTAAVEAPARSMARTAGLTLLPLLEKAKNKPGTQLAKRLSNDEALSKTQLTALRDAVNEAANEARASNKETLASQLSNANRIVRRLARSA